MKSRHPRACTLLIPFYYFTYFTTNNFFNFAILFVAQLVSFMSSPPSTCSRLKGFAATAICASFSLKLEFLVNS